MLICLFLSTYFCKGVWRRAYRVERRVAPGKALRFGGGRRVWVGGGGKWKMPLNARRLLRQQTHFTL